MKIVSAVVALLAFSSFGRVYAADTIDLQAAWSLAVEYDARYRMAGHDAQMQKKEVAKALAGYLPQVSAQFAVGRKGIYDKSSKLDPDIVHDGRNYYSSKSHVVSLSQPLVNIARIAKYKVASAGAGKSSKVLEVEKQDLMIRTVEAYCNILFSQESLESSRVLVEASNEACLRAEKVLNKGLGTVSAVDETKAAYYEALAQELKSRNSHESNLREFEKITGIYPAKLVPITFSAIESPLLIQDEDAWISLALRASPELGTARKAIDVARWQTAEARAGGYPTLSLLASWNYTQSDPDAAENYGVDTLDRFQSTYDTYSIMLQLNVPIYSGGYTRATASQSKIGEFKARDSYAWTERQISSDVRKYFRGLQTASALIEAGKRAVAFRKTALQSTEKGLGAGLSTRLDVLEALQKLEEAKLNLSRRYFQYILNLVMLEKSAGTLDAQKLFFKSWCVGRPAIDAKEHSVERQSAEL